MNKKIQVVIVLLLVTASFLGGVTVAKLKYGSDEKINSKGAEPTTVADQQAAPVFIPKTKGAKPEIKFFVMSFCPYGNQAEAGLEPVYQLLKNKVTFLPQYVIYQNYCSQAPADQKETCQKNYCIAFGGEDFCSMHGLQELNQNVREICAYNLGNQDKWWKFVSLVNKNCTAQNADTCWQAQSQTVGLDSAVVGTCEKNQKIALLKNEITVGQKYQATGSPIVYINDTIYKGGRAPEDYKKAICSAFENPPAECNQSLGQETEAATSGCN